MKHCGACATTKTRGEFSKNSSRPDGLQSQCKLCKSVTNKVWKANNEATWKASDTAWKDKDRVGYNAKRQETIRADPTLHYARTAKNKALARGALLPDNFTVESTLPFYAEAAKRTAETGIKHEVDHIVPCSAGGLHCPTNMQVLTKTANSSKGNR